MCVLYYCVCVCVFYCVVMWSCVRPCRWNKIFKSRIIQTIALYGNTSFMVAIAILVFLLIGTCVCGYSFNNNNNNNTLFIQHLFKKKKKTRWFQDKIFFIGSFSRCKPELWPLTSSCRAGSCRHFKLTTAELRSVYLWLLKDFLHQGSRKHSRETPLI